MSESHIIGGHKANLTNPTTSKEAKDHSREVLEDDFGVTNAPEVRAPGEKNPGNVAGGLKAAIHNPHVSQEAKENAQEKLDRMDV